MFDLIRLFFWTALIWFLLAVALTGGRVDTVFGDPGVLGSLAIMHQKMILR